MQTFKPIAEAQNAGNDAVVSELASKLNRAQKDRYNEYVEVWEMYNQYLTSNQAKLASYDAQIDAHRQDIAHHQNAAAQKINSYAPGYQAAVDKTVTGRQGANNGGDYAAQPKKKKSGGNCTIV